MAVNTGSKGEDYWINKWEDGSTTWHKNHVDPLLQVRNQSWSYNLVDLQ